MLEKLQENQPERFRARLSDLFNLHAEVKRKQKSKA